MEALLAAMTSAKAKISTLSTATGRLVRSAATSCAQIITISKKISTLSKTTPESSDITTNAKKISASTVTSCTAKEKTSLLTEVVSIGEALARVNTALTAVQAQIKTLTGSTASPAQLSNAISTTTTTTTTTTTSTTSS